MPQITLVGAGSQVFAKTIVGDILSYPELADSDLVLMDVDKKRLEPTRRAAEAMIDSGGVDATVTATTDRHEALDGADYVLTMINVGGLEPFENEIRIPESYGVEQAIGDTLGPGGVFRGLRSIPVVVDIAEDMAELCPEAPLLNYTNPMAPICWAVDEATDVDVVGLCHSVPHTASAVADYVGVDADDLEYWVAGINHMAWFLEATANGEDVLDDLRAAMADEATYERDTVRFEMLEHFGAFATESSHHLSEYLPYFRTDPETIETMTGTDYAERMPTATYLEGWTERTERLEEEGAPFDPDEAEIERSEEYAARIVHSLETGEIRRLNLNVRNDTGAISNLPDEACVEVPCLIDGTGVHPAAVGELPAQLAALCRSNVAVQERTVTGALSGDREAVHQAVKLDPLTAAELNLDEMTEMTEELIEANAAYLPDLD